ncbi:MAG: hypothetical protein VYC39_05405 [Myxococcota bacterium]|nr:hypothetical protein [Myxococcota bacterium]
MQFPKILFKLTSYQKRCSAAVSFAIASSLIVPTSASAEGSPIVDWVSAAFSQSYSISNAACENGRCLFLTPGNLTNSAKNNLGKAASRLSSRDRGTTSVCAYLGDGNKSSQISSVRLEQDDFRLLTNLLPGMKQASISMAINLKAAGISDSRQYSIFDVDGLYQTEEGKALIQELTTMAAQGQVSLRAKLNQKPPTDADRTVVAQLDTDRGKLGLKLLLNKNLAPKSNKQMSVIFTTPKGRTFELNVNGIAKRQEIFENMTTPSGLLKTLNLRLRAGASEDNDFIVEFESLTSSLRSGRVEIAAVPLDSRGRQLGEPVVGDWLPRVTIKKTLSEQCEYELYLNELGNKFEIAAFATYYPSDVDDISKIMRFNPNTQVVATQFDKSTLCGKDGAVP